MGPGLELPAIEFLNEKTVFNFKVPYTCIALKGQCTRYFVSGFFHESSSSKTLKITLGSFRIFSKIRGDIRKSRCITGVVDTGGK